MDLNKVNTPYYNDYGTWIRRQFPYRVQKISIDAGLHVPIAMGAFLQAVASIATTALSIHLIVSAAIQ